MVDGVEGDAARAVGKVFATIEAAVLPVDVVRMGATGGIEGARKGGNNSSSEDAVVVDADDVGEEDGKVVDDE